jgi:hypothetical protein
VRRLVDPVAPVTPDGVAAVELRIRNPVLRESARDRQADRPGTDEGKLVFAACLDCAAFSEPPKSSVMRRSALALEGIVPVAVR